MVVSPCHPLLYFLILVFYSFSSLTNSDTLICVMCGGSDFHKYPNSVTSDYQLTETKLPAIMLFFSNQDSLHNILWRRKFVSGNICRLSADKEFSRMRSLREAPAFDIY